MRRCRHLFGDLQTRTRSQNVCIDCFDNAKYYFCHSYNNTRRVLHKAPDYQPFPPHQGEVYRPDKLYLQVPEKLPLYWFERVAQAEPPEAIKKTAAIKIFPVAL